MPRLTCDAFVVSAETDSAAVRAAFRAGALTYLVKPFENTELARRLSGYAQYRRILSAATVEQSAVDAALGAMRLGRTTREAETGSQTEELILEVFGDPDAFHVRRRGLGGRRHLSTDRATAPGQPRRRGQAVHAPRYGATGQQEYRRPQPKT